MENYYIAGYYLKQQFGGDGPKWTTLEHNGVLFPPEYISHGVPVIYDGREIVLDKDAEEDATLYAKYIESEYIKSGVFKKNFWKDWRDVLGKDHEIKELDKCDFSLIYSYLVRLKEEKKLISKVVEDVDKFKIAIVDGKPQQVGNFRIEPPGIFLGRGCNPKLGRIKRGYILKILLSILGKMQKFQIHLKVICGKMWCIINMWSGWHHGLMILLVRLNMCG